MAQPLAICGKALAGAIYHGARDGDRGGCKRKSFESTQEFHLATV
jgi:hypothetical protein